MPHFIYGRGGNDLDFLQIEDCPQKFYSKSGHSNIVKEHKVLMENWKQKRKGNEKYVNRKKDLKNQEIKQMMLQRTKKSYEKQEKQESQPVTEKS